MSPPSSTPLIPLCLLFSVLVDSTAHATRIPFEVQPSLRSFHHSTSPSARGLNSRAPIPIANTDNSKYISNITIADQNVRVLLDTGSSDLWVSFPGQAPSTQDTGKNVKLSYAIGQASGNVNTAKVTFGNATVNDQAFLLVKDTKSFSGDIHAQGYDGLLGLGPNGASTIRDKLDKNAGDTFLHRAFQAQGNNAQNFITLLLDRRGDPADPFTGEFTISELVPQFQNVTSMPKMDVDKINKLLQAEQHWQIFTDTNNGLVGPDGKVVASDSIVPKAPDGQMVAVFDSGFTFSQVPRDVADAIYGRVQGAQYDTKQEIWLVPCQQYLNITFNFGGHAFPIHPMDTVLDFQMKDKNGNSICTGTFQPITTAFSLFGNFDMILGMSFMRNAYTLFDYGDWLDGSKSSQGSPFIQLLPITDSQSGKSDFIKQRLGGTDTTSDPKFSLLPPEQMQHSPVSDEEKKKKYQEKVLSRWPYILVGCLVGLALIVGLCIWRCCCRKGRKKNAVFGKKAASTAYLPLQTPSTQSVAHLPAGGAYYGGSGGHHGQHGGGGYTGHHGGGGY